MMGALTIVSCAKEIDVTVEPNHEQEPAIQKQTYTLIASTPTKTTLDGAVFNWAVGETIAVADETTTAKEFEVSADADERAAGKFTYDGSLTGSLRFAVSPANHVTIPSSSGSNVNIELPGDYAYEAGKTNAVMVSSAPVLSSGTYTAHFAHTMALVKVSYKNVPYGTKYFKLTMDQNIAGVTLTKDASSTVEITTDNVDAATVGTPQKYVTVTLTSAVTSGGISLDFYVPVPVGDYGSFKAQLFDSSDNILNEKNKSFSIGNELHLAKADIFATPVIDVKGEEWDYTFAAQSDLVVSPGKELNGLTVYVNKVPTNFEARGVAWGNGTDAVITIPYTGNVESVKLYLAQNDAANATVTVGGSTIGTANTTITDNTSRPFTFATANAGQYMKGNVVITLNNTGAKTVWLKQIIINEDDRTAQTLSFPEASYTVQIDDSFSKPTLSGAKTTVSYKSSNTSVATVDKSTGAVTLVAAGTTTITATAVADPTYKKGTASYTLRVTPVPVSIAAAIAASSDATVWTRGIVANTNKKGFVITDGTDNIFIYENDVPTVSLGDDVTVTGTRGAYNSVPQLSSPEVVYTNASGQSITRTSTNVINSTNCTEITTSKFVSVTGTLTFAGSVYSVSIDGTDETKASLYSPDTTVEYPDGKLNDIKDKTVTLTGYVVGSTASVLYVSAVNVVRIPYIEYTTPTQANAADGSIATFTVSSNVTWDVEVKSNGSYLKSAVSINSTTGVVTLTFLENESTTTDRTVTVTLSSTDASLDYSQDIEVTQKKKGTSTASVTIGDYATAHSWEDTQKYASVTIDSNITATGATNGNNSKYYTSNQSWRFYEGDSGSITITASTGTIKSVTFTYSNANNGVLKYGGDNKTSGTAVDINSNTATFTVGHSSGTKNGNVQIMAISVSYE